MSFDSDINLMDNIEACRTCGVFFLTSSRLLRQIFTPAVEDPEMMCIRRELNAWNIEISENDGFPQYICTGCIHEFQNFFKFRNSCVVIQEQLRHFYNVRLQNQNLVHVKTEIPDETEENTRDFIYVDDISDTEHEGTALSFNIPHVPIKEELIEEATIPTENAVTYEGASNTKVQQEFKMHTAYNSPNKNQLAISPQSTEESKTTVMDDDEETSSGSNLRIKCEVCNQTFANNHQQKLHMKRIHETKDVECHICGKIFKNSSATRLKFHMKWHKLCKHTKCSQCSFVCSSRESLKDHIREKHSKLTCEICSKLVSPKRMDQHMKTHSSNTVAQGTNCDEVSGFSYERDDHRNTNHFNGIFLNDNLEEEDEDKIYSNVQNAFINVEIACALCQRKFPSQCELELHVKRQHQSEAAVTMSYENSENGPIYESFPLEPKETVVLPCTNCNQEFYDQDELLQHMEHYHNGHVFANTFDGADSDHFGNCRTETEISEENTFSHDYDRNEVGDESNNQTNYLHQFGCAQCSDTFECVEHLRQHYDEMHSKKPNFECNTCGKTFELKFSLNRHLKKHENS